MSINNTDSYTVKEILSRVEDKVDKVLEDHENRLRVLEHFKNKWLGALGTIMGAAGLAANFFH